MNFFDYMKDIFNSLGKSLNILFLLTIQFWYITLPIIGFLFYKIVIKFMLSNYKNASGNGLLKTLNNYGDMGEYLVYSQLEKVKGYKKILANVYLSSKSKITEIDIIMLHETGIYVFEVKNYSGKIYGNENTTNWQRYYYNKKSTFYNPIKQNNNHIACLQKFLGNDYTYRSYIVFGKRCELKKITYDKQKTRVIRRDDFKKYINNDTKKLDKVLTIAEINTIYKNLETNILVDKEVKNAQIKYVERAKYFSEQKRK